MLLKQLTSKQITEWLAFATMEQVGNPVAPDAEEKARKEAKIKRNNLEGFFIANKGK